MDKLFYISLGAGKNQKPLIEAAIKLGYRVIGVDQNLSAEAMHLCDIKIEESILNYRKIKYKIMMSVSDSDIAGGYCASYGAALTSWAYLAEHYRLVGLGRTKTETLVDKYYIRKFLAENISDNDFFQPQFMALEMTVRKSSLEALGFPLILKPRFGHGKINIFKANSYTDVRHILSVANLRKLKIDPRSLMIEHYVDGDEITVTGIVENFKFHLVAITDKITSKEAPFIELEHIHPSKHQALAKLIEKLHGELVRTLELETTPIVSEWKVVDDCLYLIELSTQIPGEYLASFLIPRAVKYNYYENIVKLTVGELIDTPAKFKSKSCVRVKYLDKKVTQEDWSREVKKSEFAHILNESPPRQLTSNADRFGVLGIIDK